MGRRGGVGVEMHVLVGDGQQQGGRDVSMDHLGRARGCRSLRRILEPEPIRRVCSRSSGQTGELSHAPGHPISKAVVFLPHRDFLRMCMQLPDLDLPNPTTVIITYSENKEAALEDATIGNAERALVR